MSYTQTLNAIQKHNADVLVQRMIAKGITNRNTHAAVLDVISKESELIPHSEDLNYSAKRIMKVWKTIPATTAAKLERNPTALGNYVYGPQMNKSLGNGPDEGYKFRGRGYNQITGKANYIKTGKEIGVDLVSNPDLLNDPQVAADAAINFFQNGIKSLAALGKLSQYNATNINDFKTPTDSLNAIYHVNAGVGSSKAKLDADTTGGKKKAASRIEDIYNYLGTKVYQTASATSNAVKKNPKLTAIVTAGLLIAVYLLLNALKTNTTTS